MICGEFSCRNAASRASISEFVVWSSSSANCDSRDAPAISCLPATRAKQVTVCETGLMAGEGSLVAPPWVPYAERVNEEERERLKAVAEGRVPGAPAPETAPDDRG